MLPNVVVPPDQLFPTLAAPWAGLQLLTNGKEGVLGAFQAFSVVSGVQVARSEGSGP